MQKFIPRQASINDKKHIWDLYKKVSPNVGGLARSYEEITEDYINNILAKSLDGGIQLVIPNPANEESVIAEIHCSKFEPKVFGHILSDLTIVVDPVFQGKGIGKMIFKTLLDTVANERRDILRIELIARESNKRAIQFYEQIGFIVEGRFERRIRSASGEFEADIPMVWFNPNYKK